ncbi:MAG: hypothetical protein P8J64_05195 [Dehalococcoidia bacterium]|jgi:hypothetical protein|nr:hypothetical protein [Dehalococcoidia bacterium]
MSAHTSILDNILEPLSQSRVELLAAFKSVSDEYFNTSPVGTVQKDVFEDWSICEIVWYVGALDDVSRLRINDLAAGREARTGQTSRRPEHVSNVKVMLVWLNQSRAALLSSISRIAKNQLQGEPLLFKENLSQYEIILDEIIATENMSTRRVLDLVEMFRDE